MRLIRKAEGLAEAPQIIDLGSISESGNNEGDGSILVTHEQEQRGHRVSTYHECYAGAWLQSTRVPGAHLGTMNGSVSNREAVSDGTKAGLVSGAREY